MKIKVVRFPAVQKHRTLPAGIPRGDQTVPVQLVEDPGHPPQALSGIDHHRLRRLKALPRQQGPCKIKRMDSHLKAGILMHIHFRTDLKIAAVDKVHGVNSPVVFICLRRDQRRKRILTVSSGSPGTANRLHTLLQAPSFDLKFPGPGPRQMQKIKITAQKIHTGGTQLLNLHLLPAFIFHSCRLGDGVVGLIDRERQRHLYLFHFIEQYQLQHLAVVR